MNPMTDNDIAEYLLQDPAFFERHAELLSTIRLYGGHGARAASLQERQAVLLRDKIKMHEQRIMEMIRYGNENVTIANRLHAWTCELLKVSHLPDLPERVRVGLQEHFFVPQTALRLWDLHEAYAGLPTAAAVSDEIRAFSQTLDEPCMGVNPLPETSQWLDIPEEAKSVALVPLRMIHARPTGPSSECFGLLIFASPDSQRFTATMGVDFLERIAQLAAAALSPLVASPSSLTT
jgi:uncharacterized protein YigA (DUF484 family)